MDNKFIGLVIGLVVGVLLIGSLLVPTITDATATEETFTNTGYYRMASTTDEMVIRWTPSEDPFTINVNNVDISIESLKQYAYSSYSMAFSDDFIVRYYYETPTTQSIQLWNDNFRAGINTSSTYTAIITINSEGVSYTTTNPEQSTISLSHSGDYFIINPDGDYIMKYRDESAYLLKDTTIFYAGGLSPVAPSTYTSIYIEGTVDDYTVTPLITGATVSNLGASYSSIDGYVDLVAVDKLTFDTEYNAAERNQTYNYFLVPYQVTAELSDHLNAGEIAMIAVIPVLMIASLLIFAVRFVTRD